MKAIETKILLPTAQRPYRIKASDSDGNNVILSADGINTGTGLCDIRTHQIAAIELKKKMNWKGRIVGGATKKGFTFVFVS